MSADQTFYEQAASDDHYGDDATRMAIAEGLQALCYEMRTANLIAFEQLHVAPSMAAVLATRLELDQVRRG